MPIVDLEPVQLNRRIDTPAKGFVTPGLEDVSEPTPSFPSVVDATMRTENLIFSGVASQQIGASQEPEPDFKPFEEIKGTKYEQHFRSFVDVRNRAQMEAVKADIDREEEDRKIIQAAPWWMTVPAGLIAGVTDPTILLPGGAFVRSTRGGVAVSRSALNVGTAAGAAVGVQELGLHSMQHHRTGTESAVNIGASVLLGGMIGAGGSALLNRGEWSAAVRAAERDLGSDAISSDISVQLRNAGVPEDQIAANAAVVSARYNARAERLGVDPVELYRSEGIEVRRGGAETLAGRSFDQPPTVQPFYSQVERVVTELPQAKGSPDQWLNTIRNKAGVKPEEMEWLGLEGWLKQQKGSVSKDDVLGYIRANKIDVQEVEKGARRLPNEAERAELAALERRFAARDTALNTDDAGRLAELRMMRDQMPQAFSPTKFQQYTLPGGENYRELLLTLPQKEGAIVSDVWEARPSPEGGWMAYNRETGEPFSFGTMQHDEAWARDTARNLNSETPPPSFRSSHFDEPNILAHVRFNDRTIDGKRTLFIEEIQSDWHQKGKRQGYRGENEAELARLVKERDDIIAKWDSLSPDEKLARTDHLNGLHDRIREIGVADVGVPDAPFKTTWPELALKRMIRYAAENGYEKIAWTTGRVQADRYDLSKHVKEIEYIKRGPDTYELGVTDINGRGVDLPSKAMTLKDIEDTLGKEMAEKIANGEGRRYRGHEGITLDGLDLRVGGEGMRGFYDDILPKAVNKLVKRYGGRVESGDVQTSNVAREAYAVSDNTGYWVEAAGHREGPFANWREAQEATDAVNARRSNVAVHTLDMTPQLREAAIEQGFPMFQRGAEGDPRGRITLNDNKAVVELFGKADRSTFMHEMGHKWLDELAVDASKTNVPQALKDDLGTVLRWLKVDKAEDITPQHHEQWARGFEQYLAEGKAPTPALARAFEAFKQWLAEIYRSLRGAGGDISDDIRGVMDRMLATDSELGRGAGFSAPGSLGAAAVGARSVGEMSLAGRAAGGVAAATQKLNPGLRLIHSDNPQTREVALNLFEMSQYIRGNQDGLATPVAAETLRKEWDAGLARAVSDTRDAYSAYRQGGGQMSRTQFHEAVGKAMRRDDVDPVPEVQQAAKSWRSSVFDPLKEAAIKAKLLPEDVDVETAASYFSRLWNRQRLVAEEGEFKRVVSEWVNSNFPVWQKQFDDQTDRALNPLRREIDDLEMAKLRRGEELKAREQDGEVDAGSFDEADIRQAMRIVEGGAPRPKGVQTLTQFVHAAGGLVDHGGELATRGITNKTRPGFVRVERKRVGKEGGGWGLDDMARHAWESGYMPEFPNRPSVDDFLDALSDDFHKVRVVVRDGDRDAFRLTELVNKLEQDLSRIGATETRGTRFSTSEETKEIVKRVHAALDAEADQKIARLREKLNEREALRGQERDAKFLDDPRELGREIGNEVFDKLTGRVAADTGTRPEFITVNTRGPLKERTFNIPDEAVERWLESDVEMVGRRYQRIMSADVELANKFGRPDMQDTLQAVREGYARLRADVTSEKRLAALAKEEAADIRDLEGVRDIIRGTFAQSGWERDFGAIVRVANAAQYILKMGSVVLSSLTEPVRVVAAKGLTPVMRAGFSALGNLDAVKLSVKEAQLAGNALDRVLAHRLYTMADLGDFYSSRGVVEKFMDNMTNVASKWNGIRLWTDGVKMLASTLIQNQILGAVSKGTGKDVRYLAHLGIDESMAGRIAKQFADHGETLDNIRVAGTERWTDDVAKRTYRAALNKDLDSMVVTRGASDLPLFANTPLGRLIFQFNTFNLASHQRVLLRGLQEGHARFLSAVVALTGMGMLQTYLSAVSNNRVEKLPNMVENPGWWIGEGLDRSGALSVPFQIANGVEKLTGMNPIKAPVKAFDQGTAESDRFRNRNELGAVLGPSAGTIQDIGSVVGIPRKIAAGEDVTQAQKNSAERLLPFNSYFGVRQFMKYIVNPPQD